MSKNYNLFIYLKMQFFNFLKIFDILGEPARILVNKKEKIKTISGGFITFIFIVNFFYFSIVDYTFNFFQTF